MKNIPKIKKNAPAFSWLVLALVAGILAVTGFYLILNRLVYNQMQRYLKIKIEAQFYPSPWKSQFRIERTRFAWKERVEVLSGTFQVRYDAQEFLRKREIGVQIFSQDAVIKLKGDWAKFDPSGTLKMQQLSLALGLDRRGIQDIREMIAEAPSFHFQFSDKNARRPP